MVIVASVALATMVSNDLVMPPLLRRGWAQRHGGNVASTVLWIRRIAIGCFAAMAYGYYRVSGSDTTLAAYGLMSFAAVAQFSRSEERRVGKELVRTCSSGWLREHEKKNTKTTQIN